MLQLNINSVFTIINMVVLYLLLRHFLIKPVTSVMEKRQAMIEQQMAAAQDSEAEAAELKAALASPAVKKSQKYRVIERAGILTAALYCVTEPDSGRIKEIRESLCQKYGKNDVELRIIKDPGLI